ncbi:ribosomal protein S18 acetylase RimI-like enzyme [Paenibacillus phyllosphaerae]|uniref:Ribosomal protein S18 acetylase RimI-like enzyme n=1 Tax=Paenibacillus phyllosphaerae TaxID=274593 RepID=A0A7W5AWZ2_9BACL|nr:GNAT family N-acetyltransferase [Paenibacillus phyllosphaerae]MBB3110344.1 ribosomal protein S18 acetylase RimI-like enzyme [Paenibacillus phyllosphaerae]
MEGPPHGLVSGLEVILTLHKELIVYASGIPKRIRIRNYTMEDYEGMIAIQRESFPPPYPSELWWNEEQLHEHITRFPEGALCVEADGKLVGSMTGLIVDESQLEGSHSWSTISDNGFIRNHNPNGDTLYVVDVCVIPEYRKYGIGKWLMQTMYEVVVHLRLRRLLGGGRMPGYHHVADTMSAEAYLEGVITGQWKDPVITFLLRCGRLPIGVEANYLDDEESLNYAALMEWRNPFYTGEERLGS